MSFVTVSWPGAKEPLDDAARWVFVLTVGLVAAFILGGWAASAAEEAEHVVRVEVAIDDQIYPHPDGLTLRGSQGQRVSLKLEVSDADSGLPADFPEPMDLVELRPPSDGSSPVRFADMEHLGLGIYQTSYPADEPGEFSIVALPGIPDRSGMPADSFDEVALIDAQVSASPIDSSGVTVILVLVALVGWLGLDDTRERQVPKEPVMHDTWWNGP